MSNYVKGWYVCVFKAHEDNIEVPIEFSRDTRLGYFDQVLKCFVFGRYWLKADCFISVQRVQTIHAETDKGKVYRVQQMV